MRLCSYFVCPSVCSDDKKLAGFDQGSAKMMGIETLSLSHYDPDQFGPCMVLVWEDSKSGSELGPVR